MAWGQENLAYLLTQGLTFYFLFYFGQFHELQIMPKVVDI
jgi:hypothetical protein